MQGSQRPAAGTHDGDARRNRPYRRLLRRVLKAGGVLSLFILFAAVARAPRAEAMLLPPAAGSPSEAVRLAVQSLGETYLGACGAARSPEDLGKVCSRFVAARGDEQAYLLGRTFSEYNTWLFIEKTPDGWRFLRTEALTILDSASDIPWPCDCTAPED